MSDVLPPRYSVQILFDTPAQKMFSARFEFLPATVAVSKVDDDDFLSTVASHVMKQISARVAELGGLGGPLMDPPESKE